MPARGCCIRCLRSSWCTDFKQSLPPILQAPSEQVHKVLQSACAGGQKKSQTSRRCCSRSCCLGCLHKVGRGLKAILIGLYAKIVFNIKMSILKCACSAFYKYAYSVSDELDQMQLDLYHETCTSLEIYVEDEDDGEMDEMEEMEELCEICDVIDCIDCCCLMMM